MAIQKKAPGQELSDRAVRYHVVGKDHLETTMNETYDPMDFGADTAQRHGYAGEVGWLIAVKRRPWAALAHSVSF